VAGIEELKMDIELTNPEITVSVDRQRALNEGISTGQVGAELRTALFGKEISKLKDNEDEYKIQLRSEEISRNSLSDLMNMTISFRDFPTAQPKKVPIYAVTKHEISTHYGRLKPKKPQKPKMFWPGQNLRS